ncbi:HDOD domain-containing protein [Thermovibrio sp.]
MEVEVNRPALKVVSDTISSDPGLTAKVLEFVNSAYFNLKVTISSVEDAVAYLGYKHLKEVAYGILLSAILKNKSKEELLKFLTLAYFMKAITEKKRPELSHEAFFVGILTPIYEKEGKELLKLLKELKVSQIVIDGITNPKSLLGTVREVARKVLPACMELHRGKEVKKINKQITENCLRALYKAEKLLNLL